MERTERTDLAVDDPHRTCVVWRRPFPAIVNPCEAESLVALMDPILGPNDEGAEAPPPLVLGPPGLT